MKLWTYIVICLVFLLTHPVIVFSKSATSFSAKKWSNILDKPGSYSMFYPKIKLSSWLDQLEAIAEEEGGEDSLTDKKDVLLQVRDRILESFSSNHQSKQKSKSKPWKHTYDLPSDSIVEEVNGDETIDISQLLLRGLSSLQLVKDKYKKLLVLPIVKTGKSPRALDKYLNAMIVSLPSWPIGWKHFTFATRYSMESDEDKDGAILEIQLVEGKSPKPRMKIVASITLRDGGLYIDGAEVSYEGLKRSETELIATTILQVVKQALRDQYNIRKVRKHQQKQYKSEADTFQAEKKKQELDRIINPDKYKTKSATVRRVGDGNGRYKPSAATQARRQVRSK